MIILKRTFQDILEAARTYFQKTGSNAVDISGTPEHALSRIAASEISALYNSMDHAVSSMSLELASGVQLDDLAKQFGITRNYTTAAYDVSKRNVKFYINPAYDGDAQDMALELGESNIVIKAGTQVSNGDNKRYYVTEDVVFGDLIDPAGDPVYTSVFVNVMAYSVGSNNNVTSGELTQHNLNSDPILSTMAEYINVTNLLPITSGANQESDNDLRYRITNALPSNNTGNSIAIIDAALGVPGVAGASIHDNIYGTGTFGVYIDSTAPLISSGLINAVHAAITRVKPVGVKGYVLHPTYVGIKFDFDISYVSKSQKTQTMEAIRNSIMDYVNNLKRGDTLIINKIMAIVNSNTNVHNAQIKSMTGGEYNIVLELIENGNKMHLVDQTIDITEKWFTASGLITFCTV